PFSNDDFAYFQQKVPGVYFFLGGSNFQKGLIAMIHAPNFGVEEESIRTGVKVFSSLLFEKLK
ncbi:MAG: amidohydrolase, partial [Spirosomaceae bacterium]|nr:amidohydrolase [Spirosomataceae bacterium]